MLFDTGAMLDWLEAMAVEKKWKVTKLNVGPGKNWFTGLHPDALRVMMRSGMYIIMYRVAYSQVHTVARSWSSP